MKKTQETWTVLKVLNWTREYLSGKGVENPRLEAEWMLCAALSMDRVGLYVNFDKPLLPRELSLFREMVARRAKREPLQYILGSQEFMGLEFDVSPAVLVPRHDTETLVEEAVKRCPHARKILDIGVGSGCVAIALAKLLPQAEVFGVDTSGKALDVAGENAGRNGVLVTLRQGSLFEPFSGFRFDLIVSNPPYIPSGDIAALQPEVRDFEPRDALDGGPDGLHFYRSIISAATRYLDSGGWLLFEVGIGQATQVLALFEQEGCFDSPVVTRDLSGIERVVGGRKI